jgi:ADP-ribosyl-[dinitrogen reductase] hydrolase
MTEHRIVGCILGTAVGDAMGLPYEGLSRRRGSRFFGPPDRQRFFFGRGMVSDDTEHTCMVAQSLIAANGDVTVFQRSLAWRLRLWLLGVPAGIGLATLGSIIRLWFGISPDRSGVFSAGNGPAMRAAIIGATFDDPKKLRDFVRASTRITHTDPKSEFGAYAVAIAARMAAQVETVSPDAYLDRLHSTLDGDAAEFLKLMTDTVASVNAGQTTDQYADSLGLTNGITGYIYHSVPIAIHAWLKNPIDYRSAVTSVIRCGGDTDSVAAIVGGIIGASVGRDGIPPEWRSNMMVWPRSMRWMEQLGNQLESAIQSGSTDDPIRLPVAGLLARNVLFITIVLFHGFRRVAPPY